MYTPFTFSITSSVHVCNNNLFSLKESGNLEAAPADTAAIASTSDDAAGNSSPNKPVNAAVTVKVATTSGAKTLASKQVCTQFYLEHYKHTKCGCVYAAKGTHLILAHPNLL